MSVLGTGVAAAVAQTSLQAKQVAHDRDRKKAQNDQNNQRLRESFEAHLHQLEDAHQVEPVDRLQIDGHLSQNHPQQKKPTKDEAQNIPVPQDGEAGPANPAGTPPAPAGEASLYRHLDVQG